MFGGLNKYAVYAKLFMTLAKSKIYDMNTMGVGEGGLGTHPCRKGVVTMVAKLQCVSSNCYNSTFSLDG